MNCSALPYYHYNDHNNNNYSNNYILIITNNNNTIVVCVCFYVLDATNLALAVNGLGCSNSLQTDGGAVGCVLMLCRLICSLASCESLAGFF